MLHDIGIFLKPFDNSCATEYIFDAWQGERIESEFKSESIDATKVAKLEENKRQLLSLLFKRWDKDVPDKDLAQTRPILQAHYTQDDLRSFDRAVAYNQGYLEQVNSIEKNVKDVEKLLRARWRRLF